MKTPPVVLLGGVYVHKAKMLMTFTYEGGKIIFVCWDYIWGRY